MKTSLSVVFILFSTLLFSQAKEVLENRIKEKENEHFTYRVALQLGLSNPLGDFKSSDLYDPNSGFAEQEFNIEGNYTLMFDKNIGLSVALGHSSFAFNNSDFLLGLRAANPGASVSNEFENYSQLYYTIGLKVVFGSNAKFYLNPVIGGSLLTMGELNTTLSGVDTSGQNVLINIKQFQSEATSFIYGFNAGVDTFLSENVSFLFNIQYYVSDYEFDQYGVIDVISGPNRGSGNINATQSIPFKALNLTVGLGYHFN